MPLGVIDSMQKRPFYAFPFFQGREIFTSADFSQGPSFDLVLIEESWNPLIFPSSFRPSFSFF